MSWELPIHTACLLPYLPHERQDGLPVGLVDVRRHAGPLCLLLGQPPHKLHVDLGPLRRLARRLVLIIAAVRAWHLILVIAAALLGLPELHGLLHPVCRADPVLHPRR